MPILADGKLPKLRNRKLSTIQIDNFNAGVNVLLSETRLNKNEAKEATNLWLVEDGLWDKRPGTQQYGPLYTNVPDGFAEFRKTDGTRELIVVADGKLYRVDPDASTKTEITGATFTQGTRVSFLQLQDKLYISNGVDDLATYDGTDLVTFAGLDTPENLTATRNTLGAGSFNYYYRVTASNSVGETIASTQATEDVDKDRDLWTSTDAIDLDWDDVTGALFYTVYFADTSGFEVKLVDVQTSSYSDDGSAAPNPFIETPDDDSTTGPKISTMWINGNRIWGTGDPENPYRVYFTGTGANLGNWSPAYGGGWVDLEKGGRATTVTGVDFQGVSNVFVKTDDGRGNIWQVTLSTQTIGSEDVIVPIPTKIISSAGTNAERSVVVVENDVLFMNSKAIYALGNESGILNVLRSNELSTKVRPYIQSLDESSMDKVAAYYSGGKVYFAVPASSGEPNKILILDRERVAWIKDWSIGVSQFGEFTDAGGITRLLGINGDHLVDFSENYQGDEGVAFDWKYISPRIPMAKDWTKFARIKKTYIKLRNTQGTVVFTVQGTERKKSFANLGSQEITPGISSAGMGWDPMGSVQIGDSAGTPATFAEESLIKYININKLIRDIRFVVSGTALNDRAILTGLKAEGLILPTAPPSDWKLS